MIREALETGRPVRTVDAYERTQQATDPPLPCSEEGFSCPVLLTSEMFTLLMSWYENPDLPILYVYPDDIDGDGYPNRIGIRFGPDDLGDEYTLAFEIDYQPYGPSYNSRISVWMHKNSGEIYYFREENWDATDEDVDAAERCAQDLLNEYFSDYL